MFWKALSRCGFWLCWLLAFWLGSATYLLAVCPALRNSLAHGLLENIPAYRVETAYIAAGVVIIALATAWAEQRRAVRRVTGLMFNTPEGQVLIGLETISNFIERLLRSHGGVRGVAVRTARDERKVNVTARIRVTDQRPVVALVAELQQAVRSRAQETFGVDLIRDIRIEIAQVIPTRPASQRLLSWHAKPGETRADIAGGAAS